MNENATQGGEGEAQVQAQALGLPGEALRVVVPISGGKDSQACLKLALEVHPPSAILGLFCDTKFEHPETYRHIERISTLYGVHIHTISTSDVPTEILKVGYFPSGRARFCTERLKIRPSAKFYRVLAEQLGHGFEVWLGMRSDESKDRELRYRFKTSNDLYTPHEVNETYPRGLSALGVSFKLPVLDWSKLEILTYTRGELNPLYYAGFDRVGCFPCLAAGDKTKRMAFEHDAFGQSQWEIVQELENQVGESVYTSKGKGKGRAVGASQENPGCAFCSI